MEEEPTFAELNMPFPLFEAPARLAAQYVGPSMCTLCRSEGLCFRLEYGGEILEECNRCGYTNALPAGSGATHSTCDNCRNLIPVDPRYRNAAACYACLRGGRASITHDTECGIVRYEDAVAGKPLGHSDGETPSSYFAMSGDGVGVKVDVSVDNEPVAFPVSKEWLFELTRTPNYSTIQGDSWQFHCDRPMVYVGEWGRKDFENHSANGDGKTLFEQAVGDSEPGLWEAMWAGEMHDEFAIYMFRCPTCGQYRGHWDMF